MTSGKVAAVAAVVLLAGATFVPAPALAEEAFLCGPSKVVYVKSEEIELKKKTDPCIAAYFGLVVEEAPPASADKRSTKAQPLRSIKTGPQFKTLSAPEQVERLTQERARTAVLMPPEAAPNTDFRNVRVINAKSEDARWFRHDK